MEDIKAILNSIKKHTDVEADKGVTRCQAWCDFGVIYNSTGNIATN